MKRVGAFLTLLSLAASVSMAVPRVVSAAFVDGDSSSVTAFTADETAASCVFDDNRPHGDGMLATRYKCYVNSYARYDAILGTGRVEPYSGVSARYSTNNFPSGQGPFSMGGTSLEWGTPDVEIEFDDGTGYVEGTMMLYHYSTFRYVQYIQVSRATGTSNMIALGQYSRTFGLVGSAFDDAWPPNNFGTAVEPPPGVCDDLVVNWDPVGQQVVSSQRFTITKPSSVEWDDLFIRASFSYGFDEFFSKNAQRTSLYNAVQLAIYIPPVVVSTDGNTRVYRRTPYQPMDNDYFNVICQPSDSLAGDDVMVFRRSNGDGGEPEPEGVRGLRPCLYVNLLFETPSSDTRTVGVFIPSNAPLTMGDPGGVISLEYGQILDSGLRREVGPFDSFDNGAPPFTAGPVETVGTVTVPASVSGEFGRQFVVCTDVLGEVVFEEPQRPEDGGTTRSVGAPILINPDAVDGWNVDVTLDPVSGQPIGDPVDGEGSGGDPGGGGSGSGGESGSGLGGDGCSADWGWKPWSWGGSTLDSFKCALAWAFVPSDVDESFDAFVEQLGAQFPFSMVVAAADFLGDVGDELETASGSGCFTGTSSWSFGDAGTVSADDVCIGDGMTVNPTQRATVLTLMLAPMVWALLSYTWFMLFKTRAPA